MINISFNVEANPEITSGFLQHITFAVKNFDNKNVRLLWVLE